MGDDGKPQPGVKRDQALVEAGLRARGADTDDEVDGAERALTDWLVQKAWLAQAPIPNIDFQFQDGPRSALGLKSVLRRLDGSK